MATRARIREHGSEHNHGDEVTAIMVDIVSARDAEICQLKQEYLEQRDFLLKQVDNERRRNVAALTLAESKYTELKTFVNVWLEALKIP